MSSAAIRFPTAIQEIDTNHLFIGQTNEPRHSIYPIQQERFFQFYKEQLSNFWQVEEVDLTQDVQDFHYNITHKERETLKKVLAFFAVSDEKVLQNINDNFLPEIPVKEVSFFYTAQAMIETIHSEMYSLLVDTLISDKVEKEKLLNSVDHFGVIAAKTNWMNKFMSSDKPLNERIIAFICVEGIMFTSCFATIFHFRNRNVLPGLLFSNELISRDETLHRDFGIHMYLRLLHQTEEKKVNQIVDEAVQVECAFIDECIEDGIDGLNKNNLKNYAKFMANTILYKLQLPILYPDVSSNPISYMDKIGLSLATNFFEHKVSQYSTAVAVDPKANRFSISTTF